MNDYSTEDLMGMISLCLTLNDAEKNELQLRVFDDLTAHGNHLSPELAEELNEVFSVEVAYRENQYTVQEADLIRTYEKIRDEELETLRPKLNQLVSDYRQETQEMLREYDETFRKLDARLDHLAQEAKDADEASKIDSIKSKLQKNS